MLKKSLIITSILALTACAKFYARSGNTPEDLSRPTLSEKYVVMGAFWSKDNVDTESYSSFAKKKCIENDYKKADGYAVSSYYTGGWMLFGIVPMSETSKTVKIYCK